MTIEVQTGNNGFWREHSKGKDCSKEQIDYVNDHLPNGLLWCLQVPNSKENVHMLGFSKGFNSGFDEWYEISDRSSLC